RQPFPFGREDEGVADRAELGDVGAVAEEADVVAEPKLGRERLESRALLAVADQQADEAREVGGEERERAQQVGVALRAREAADAEHDPIGRIEAEAPPPRLARR